MLYVHHVESRCYSALRDRVYLQPFFGVRAVEREHRKFASNYSSQALGAKFRCV